MSRLCVTSDQNSSKCSLYQTLSTMAALLILLCSALSVVFAAPMDCGHGEQLLKCLKDVGLDINNITYNPAMFPVTEEDLQAKCAQFLPYWDCSLTYLNRCPHILPPSVMEFYEEEAEQQRETCQPDSAITKRYLEYSKCFRDNFDFLRECGVYDPADPKGDPVKNACRQFEQFFGCYMDKITETCGTAAAQVMKDMSVPRRKLYEKTCKKSQ